MPAPTREELILNLKSNPKTKGMTDAQIAAKADEILPKLVEKYGGEATVKETVKAKIAEKAKPTASTAPKTTPLPTRSAPARPSPLPVVPSGTTAASPSSARDFMAPEPTPMLDKSTIPSYVTRYGGMGEIRKDEDEIAGMRAAMKAMKPAKAALVDAMDDADVAAAYKRLNAE